MFALQGRAQLAGVSEHEGSFLIHPAESRWKRTVTQTERWLPGQLTRLSLDLWSADASISCYQQLLAGGEGALCGSGSCWCRSRLPS